MYDKDPKQLLDVQRHQLWFREPSGQWYPVMDKTWQEDDYDRALRAASYYTQQGKEVRLVTSVITFVL